MEEIKKNTQKQNQTTHTAETQHPHVLESESWKRPLPTVLLGQSQRAEGQVGLCVHMQTHPLLGEASEPGSTAHTAPLNVLLSFLLEDLC